MNAQSAAKAKTVEARLFWNGRSQAVRLPKEFRFEGDRVRVTRMGAGCCRHYRLGLCDSGKVPALPERKFG